MPKDVPPRSTVNGYFKLWDYDGTLDRIHHTLYVKCRERAATLFGSYPFLLKLYADGGYQGAQFQDALFSIMRQIDIEIVKRSDPAKGFAVLPKRWIVERTISWLNGVVAWPKTGNA